MVNLFQWTVDWARARGLKVWAMKETGSTNSIAKNDVNPSTKPYLESELASVSKPSLYITDFQSQGRGRGSHIWQTPPGSSLLSSWSFALTEAPQPILSPLVGLALFEAATETWPEVSFNLKAPNDLFIGEQKTAGLLIETIIQGFEKRTAVGLGFNIEACPADLTTATCLASHLTQGLSHHDWTQFLERWSSKLTKAMMDGQTGALKPQARESLKSALNLHPLLSEPILNVDEMGQLHSASRVVHWHEL